MLDRHLCQVHNHLCELCNGMFAESLDADQRWALFWLKLEAAYNLGRSDQREQDRQSDSDSDTVELTASELYLFNAHWSRINGIWKDPVCGTMREMSHAINVQKSRDGAIRSAKEAE